MPIRSVLTRDTQKDLAPLLNAAEERHGVDAVALLAGCIAEGGLREYAIRERAWPDVSYGLFQPTVKWWGNRVPGVTLAGDGTALDTPENRRLCREWYWDAQRSVDAVAPFYAALVARWGDPLSAWCRWNKPSIPGAQNPNRANYERALAEAERYRVESQPEPTAPRRAKILGLNIDPARGDCPPEVIAATGAQAVRLVLRFDPDVLAACLDYRQAGLKVLGVIARESAAEFSTWQEAAEEYADFAHLVDWWQIGNEYDQVGPSSWTMTQAEYEGLVAAFSRIGWQIGAGLASGDASKRYRNGWPIGVHPYSEGEGIGGWLDRYRGSGQPFWITEWWPNEQATRLALQQTDVDAVFWWWHDPVDSHGWLSINDNPYDIDAFKRLVKEFTVPEYEVGPGVKEAMQRKNDEPRGNERYFAQGYSLTAGRDYAYLYSAESNEVYAISKA